ncbi:MAG TPA: amidohydrolase, partial [Bacteroidia bacterium]|nr:amidohydrolase [Bacteroidia bacterium]
MSKRFPILLFAASTFLYSCSRQKEQADLILHNAIIYSVDSAFTVREAMAVKNGIILEVGSNAEILGKYTAAELVDVQKKIIFPGFIDAHCHFVAYGLGLRQVNLVGTTSFKEIISRVIDFSKTNKSSLDNTSPTTANSAAGNDTSWIIGRGWDQNDWSLKQYPTKKELDSIFPYRPVMLTRIDGHAALVNSLALKKAGINGQTKIAGGEILTAGDQPTGILIDRAVDLVNNVIPQTREEDLSEALMSAQEKCLAFGLTTVDDAGLMKSDVDIVDQLQQSGKLKMRMYAMLSDSLPNYDFYLKNGPYKTERLNVRAFKFYADGAMGSRGACLFKDYSDKKDWKGFLLTPRAHFEKYAALLNEKGFQMNTHCIGDSALGMVLQVYKKYCDKKSMHRWRIEHAQILDEEDFKNFSTDIIPSVQPTHATSDMYWVETRLGKERVKNAYAYRDLLNASGTIALGTDFPVEDISPFKTFYAAVARKDSKGFPESGFQPENALTREQTIRGMTIWAAYSNFEETEKGSLEKGKLADFVIVDTDLMNCEIQEVLKAKVLATY